MQYGNFKNFEKYNNGEFSYNPEAPIYSAKYQLHNDDYNVRQLRKRYDISTKETPKLLLKGGGDLKIPQLVKTILNLLLLKEKVRIFILTIVLNSYQVSKVKLKCVVR